MINFLMFFGLFLIFVAFPASIITTIILAVKKKKPLIPAICIPVSVVTGIIFILIGGYLYGNTDEYKEHLKEEEAKKKIEATENEKATESTTKATKKSTTNATTKSTTKSTTKVEKKDATKATEKAETEDEYKNSCQEYNFKDVLRYPSDYVGKRVKVKVEISSVHEKSMFNSQKYYLCYSENEYGFYGDKYAVFDTRDGEVLKLLEDDVIMVYGEIAEPEYTESLIVNSEEVFAIKMKYVDLISE